MLEAIVTTQVELDAALANKKVDWIEIRSPRGVWLEVRASGSATVRAYGSATVRAYDSATVNAYDSATVNAYGSATVNAYDSATVRAYGSATVRAYDSATVRAYDSATVNAYGSATVRAYDSATVNAYGSATVNAYDSATVRATPYTAIHLHSASVHLTGGTVIDHTKVNLNDATAWCEYNGVEVTDGVATVFKAVNDQWTTYRGTDYTPGQKPTAPDFNRRDECGGGLHFGPTPTHALRYFPEATKFLAAKVSLKDLISLTDGSVAKCKAPTVVAPLVECDIDGSPAEGVTA